MPLAAAPAEYGSVIQPDNLRDGFGRFGEKIGRAGGALKHVHGVPQPR